VKRRRFLQLTVGTAASLSAVAGAPAAEGPSDRRSDADDSLPEVAYTRRVPERYQADVAVIGGGIAGISAACAAARSGAQVVLVERFAVTGGNLTSGGVAHFCGQLHGQGEVFDEILKHLKAFGALGENRPVFHYEILAVVLQEMLLARGVKLLLHTRFVDAVHKDRRITHAVVCGKSGPEALRASQWIDCTGDADVARMCGFDTVKGRPEDGLPLPMSLMYFVRQVDSRDARAQLPEGWFEPVRTQDDLPMTSMWPDGPRSTALKIKIPMFDSTDTESLTAAEIRARRRMFEVLDYYQRVQHAAWLLDHASPIIGIREGARIVGDYVLKVDDLRAGRDFDDAVARGTYPLDGHKPDDDKRTYILPKDKLHVPPYQIPLRSLIARDGVNLMMAGRCMSADQLALSSARVSTTCSMMGQAAGITAAMAAGRKCGVRDLDPQIVRREVERRGAELAV